MVRAGMGMETAAVFFASAKDPLRTGCDVARGPSKTEPDLNGLTGQDGRRCAKTEVRGRVSRCGAV